jgi:putative copper export protein
MLALRFAAVLALVVWIGGLVTLGALAAPAAFEVLGARGAEGRALAGSVVGETLRRFNLVTYTCAAVVLLSLTVRRVLGPRPRRFAIRFGGLLLMTAAALYGGVVVAPQIARTQQSIGAAPSTLDPADPRRVEFGRLHAQSVSVQLVPLLGGLVLLLFELKD